MKKNEQDVIEQTVESWKKRTGRDITRENAREMIHNISEFFQVLSEWDKINQVGQKNRIELEDHE